MANYLPLWTRIRAHDDLTVKAKSAKCLSLSTSRARMWYKLSILSLQLDVIGVTADLTRLQMHTAALNVFVFHGFSQTITTLF